MALSSPRSTFLAMPTSSPSADAKLRSSNARNGAVSRRPRASGAMAAPPDINRVPQRRTLRASESAPTLIPVQHVDREVDRHEEDGDEEDGGLGERVVALIDRPEDEAPDTGEREDLFDDDGAAEENAHLEAGDGHDGDERVLEGVFEDDGSAGQALGSGRPDVFRAQDVEHAGARGARDVGSARSAEAQRRQQHDRQIP